LCHTLVYRPEMILPYKQGFASNLLETVHHLPTWIEVVAVETEYIKYLFGELQDFAFSILPEREFFYSAKKIKEKGYPFNSRFEIVLKDIMVDYLETNPL